MRSTLLATSALVSIALAMPAYAQDAAEDGAGIGDIVVTAQRKEESLQDAAIAIVGEYTDPRGGRWYVFELDHQVGYIGVGDVVVA